jgi:hypothetical protein
MKKIGIVAALFVALGLIGVGCGSSAASTNECTALANALTTASKGNGCSSLATAAQAYTAEAANCPAAAVDSNLVSCYTGCIAKLTDCTSATALQAYSTCEAGCKP